MLGSLVSNGMMISERELMLKHVKRWVSFGQLWRAVKIRSYLIDGDELSHEFIV